jgi:phage terminase large subunit-like protein
MAKSLMEQIALLPEDQRNAVLSDMDMDTLLWDWKAWGRPEQQAPEGDWNIWAYIAGRGAGKTRTAAEWVREEAKHTNKGQLRFALVARTAADVRDVIVEGESGIINVSPPSEKPHYEPSKRRLTWSNGNTATCFTADEPDSLRGPQFTHAWGDEVAAWRQTPDAAGMTAFDNLRVGTRLGDRPKIMVTTTPKRVALLYQLIEESKKNGNVVITRGSTMDNSGNLSTAYMEAIMGVYEGTRLAAQEL